MSYNNDKKIIIIAIFKGNSSKYIILKEIQIKDNYINKTIVNNIKNNH